MHPTTELLLSSHFFRTFESVFSIRNGNFLLYRVMGFWLWFWGKVNLLHAILISLVIVYRNFVSLRPKDQENVRIFQVSASTFSYIIWYMHKRAHFPSE